MDVCLFVRLCVLLLLCVSPNAYVSFKPMHLNSLDFLSQITHSLPFWAIGFHFHIIYKKKKKRALLFHWMRITLYSIECSAGYFFFSFTSFYGHHSSVCIVSLTILTHKVRFVFDSSLNIALSTSKSGRNAITIYHSLSDRRSLNATINMKLYSLCTHTMCNAISIFFSLQEWNCAFSL